MGESWIVSNLNAALSTWNDKLEEIWSLLTESPQTFKGGQVWNVMTGMLPNIVFQIPQPSLIVIYQSLNIFPLREGHQIAVPSFMKADDSGKPCHLGHFQQGVVVILGGTDI